MSYTVRIKDVTPQQLVLARRRCAWIEWGETIQELLREVWASLNRLESVTVGQAMARVTEVDDKSLEIEAGFPVAETIEAGEGFEIGALEAGRAATVLHEGPYERLFEASTALDEWVAREQLIVDDSPWFVFWASPDDVDSPAQLQTELVLPIRGMAS